MTVDFPSVERPLLSVVVVTHGGWDWPRRALEALRDHTDPVYEVTVVDNDSPDETPERLPMEIRGARIILNDRNVGFAPAANQGAAEARGRYLCFLNPDALVQTGWLPPLLEVFDRFPSAGAAVPRFLNLDGSLQEAASLVDRDARTLAYGRDEDPEHPSFRFRRVVDFGSAACLVMRRSVFRRVGGFDVAYLPAYCEDVDLCFALREAGLWTFYVPRSTVVHAGAGSTDDVVRGRLIDSNRPVLLARWSGRLGGRPPLGEPAVQRHRVAALRDAPTTDRILIVCPGTAEGRGAWVAGLAAHLADTRPDTRVTLVVERGDPRPALLDQGVEALAAPADLGTWLEERRYHYSAAILVGPGAARLADEALRRSQPAALRAYVPDPSEGPQPEAASAADVILCPDPPSARAAETLAPGVPVVVVPEPDPGGRSLAAALSFLGIELPAEEGPARPASLDPLPV